MVFLNDMLVLLSSDVKIVVRSLLRLLVLLRNHCRTTLPATKLALTQASAQPSQWPVRWRFRAGGSPLMAAAGSMQTQPLADRSLRSRSQIHQPSTPHGFGGRPYAGSFSWDEIIYTNVHVAQRI